jgi:flagellar assembly protein FliH
MFSKGPLNADGYTFTVSSFQYRPTDQLFSELSSERKQEELPREPEVRLTEKSLNDRLAAERAAGYSAAEAAMRREFEAKAEASNEKVLKAIAEFEKAQKAYFSRVEAEVVHLALAIAGKILHREAQVDPMLLAAIVHLALGQLKEGSSASIRVRPDQAQRWRDHLASLPIKLEVKVVEDADLERGDCLLDTELGTVNFSLDAQLKEVERGFFDVLAQKPQI